MTKQVPYLTEEYGILPWHFGGPQELTYDEVAAYVRHYEDKRKAEKDQAKANRGSSGTRRR